jgi:hypothetical protein
MEVGVGRGKGVVGLAPQAARIKAASRKATHKPIGKVNNLDFMGILLS